MPAQKTDDRVTKRRVTMRSISLGPEGEQLETIAEDYVRPDILEAYVLRARQNWQQVTVSDEPDAGPGGYDGATYVPAGINHPLAHSYYPASDCKNCKHAPEGARIVTGSEG